MVAAGLGAVSSGGVLLSPPAVASRRPRGEWLAGDFHCHTVFSGDVWAGPGDDNTGTEQAYTYGHTPGEQIAVATARGLEFLAITDHNRVTSIHQPDYRSEQLILVPGYEHSLPDADHSGVFVPSADLLPDVISSQNGTRAWLDEIHARGGMAIVNHPFYGNPLAGDALSWDQAVTDTLQFDAVEVWNTMWLTRHEVLPNYDPDNHLAVQWWERTFAPTRRGPAVGASDNHWKMLDPVAGVGQPTTWVYASERSAAGIIAGVRAGRTSIAWQPPALGGPRLLLDVVEEWSHRATMIGGSVRGEGPLLAVVTVHNAPGQRLRLVTGGEVVHHSLVTSAVHQVEVPLVLPTGGWLRAELLLEERLALTALTSCVYADGRAPARVRKEPTRGRPVTYDGTGLATLPPPPDAQTLPACSCSC